MVKSAPCADATDNCAFPPAREIDAQAESLRHELVSSADSQS